MKRRLLVMNGQRILQSDHGGQWQVDKVDRAGALKPGIYNLYLAVPADRGKAHEGVVVHADQAHVYQQVGKSYVLHERAAFDKVPEVGQARSIAYNQGRAVASEASVVQGRKLSR